MHTTGWITIKQDIGIGCRNSEHENKGKEEQEEEDNFKKAKEEMDQEERFNKYIKETVFERILKLPKFLSRKHIWFAGFCKRIYKASASRYLTIV